MALTDVAIKNAKPRAKPYKLGDSDGLFLLVQPSGGKLWRLKYRINGREKKLAIGKYPAISLAKARSERDVARDMVAKGKDPSLEKQRNKIRTSLQADNTFTAITREFCEKRKRDGDKAWSAATAKRSEYLLSLLDRSIGRMAINEIEPPDVLAAIRKIEANGDELSSLIADPNYAPVQINAFNEKALRDALAKLGWRLADLSTALASWSR